MAVGRPIWRVDLLESLDAPGSFDRTHHHPAFDGWEPGPRRFVDELSADPLAWVGARLSDLDQLLDQVGFDRAEVGSSDGHDLALTVPEITDALRRLLDRVRAGELGRAPDQGEADRARVGWL